MGQMENLPAMRNQISAQPSSPLSATGLLQISSETIRSAMENYSHRMVTTEHGADFIRDKWICPAVTEETRQQAQQLLVIANKSMERATPKAIREWLNTLGMLTASNGNSQEVMVRVEAMIGILPPKPQGIFTKDSLGRAAASFKFFPIYQELIDFLEGEERELEQVTNRLSIMADARAPKTESSKPSQEPDPAEELRNRQAMGVKLGELAAAIADPEKMNDLQKRYPSVKEPFDVV